MSTSSATARDSLETKGASVERSARQTDILAVWIWLGASSAVTVCLLVVSFVGVYPGRPPIGDILSRWSRFDFIHFVDIARFGYFPAPGVASTPAPLYAFFPLFPYLLKAGLVLHVPVIVTGLAVSWISGAAATVWISRLANLYQPGLGLKAAAVFVAAPPAIFLFAPYTEALFLAFALGAWYFGKRQRWLLAGLMCALSSTARITGAFLLISLIVLWLTQHNWSAGGRRRWSLLNLGIPAAALAAWMGALWYRTGDPLAYQTAQKYWGRHFEWPWTAAASTLNSYPPTGGQTLMAYLEIAAVAVGVVLTVILIVKKYSGEAVFVAINIILLATSTYFYSVPRAALLWWPLWIGIAYLLRRRRVLFWLYLALSTWAMLAWSTIYFSGFWAG